MLNRAFLFLAALFAGVPGVAQRLSNAKPLTTAGDYTNPVLSPDEKHVLLTKHHLQGVYLLNVATAEITAVSGAAGSGYGYCWAADGKSFFYREKPENGFMNDAVVKSYSLATKKAVAHADGNPAQLGALAAAAMRTDLVVYTNPKTLKIEARRPSTGKTWVVTPDNGQYYNAVLSGDGKQVLVHKGADVYVYRSDGTGMIKKLGAGIATAWSRDGKYALGFLDESTDGHEISNSELYCFEVQTARRVQLTRTADQLEMYPSFNSRGDKVVFVDEKAGRVYIANISF